MAERGLAPHARAFAAASALVASACAPAPAPLPPVAGPSPEQLAGQLESAYARWSEHDVTEHCSVYLSACADAFARKAGFDPGALREPSPRALLANPDPEWIPGWNELPTADESRHLVFEALAYAASQRAVRKACEQDFNGVLARRADLASRLAIEVLSLASAKGLHERIGRIVGLRSELRRGDVDPVGALYHAELMVWHAFEDAGLGYLWRAQDQRSADVGSLRPALETSIELDLHCRARHELVWQDQRPELARFVKPALDPERAAAIQAADAQARDLERRLPASAPGTLRRIEDGPSPSSGAKVQLERLTFGIPLRVRSIETTKAGPSIVELTGSRERDDAPLGCSPTDRIEKVRPDGQVRYAEDCKRGPLREELVVRVRLLELPSRPEIAVGDQLVVVGALSKDETSTDRAKKTTVERRRISIDEAVVVEMWRDTMLLANFFFQ
jgi:hypothetical protein